MTLNSFETAHIYVNINILPSLLLLVFCLAPTLSVIHLSDVDLHILCHCLDAVCRISVPLFAADAVLNTENEISCSPDLVFCWQTVKQQTSSPSLFDSARMGG